MTVYTLIVEMPVDPAFEPWGISFSSRQKAEEYAKRLTEHMRRAGIADDMVITMDSGELDDGQYYLDEIDHWFD